MGTKIKVLILDDDLTEKTDIFNFSLNGWQFPYKLYLNNGWKYIHITDFVNNIETINDFLTNKFGKLPDVLFFNTLYKQHEIYTKCLYPYIDKIKEIKCLKIIMLDDLHSSKKFTITQKEHIYKEFNIVLATCGYCFNDFFPNIDKSKVYFIPHAVYSEFYIELNNNPKEMIRISGQIKEDIYPIRTQVLKLQDKYPINKLTHPKRGKKDYSKLQVGKRYIECLNKYICCLGTDACKLPYIVKKFFEIPISGSLLLAGLSNEQTKIEMEKLGFIDMETCIFANSENIHEKIEFILDKNNRDIVDNIRKRGQHLVLNNHLHSHRVTVVESIIDEYL